MKGILLENDEIAVKNGKMIIGDNAMDIIERVIDSNVGEWKEDATMGVGIANMLNGEQRDDIVRVKIMDNVEKNNINYETIEIQGGEITVTLE